MQVVIEKDPISFLNKYEAWLRQKTVEHNLFLGKLQDCKNGKFKEMLFFAILENNEPVLLALETSNKDLLLSEGGSKESFEHLSKALMAADANVSIVNGSVSNVEIFVNIYAGFTGKEFVSGMDTHLYVVTDIVMPVNVEGELVSAIMADLNFITKCRYQLSKEALPERDHVTMDEARETSVKAIENNEAVIWRVKGNDMTMGFFNDLGYVARIRSVYTPPEFRGHGYAAAMTAQVSQLLLDKGCDSVCLFADADNATSNGVYQRIGYKHVTDSIVYVLKD